MTRKQQRTTPALDEEVAFDPAHAPGKRRMGPPREQTSAPRAMPAAKTHDQPWVPTSGLVGRTRRSARRG